MNHAKVSRELTYLNVFLCWSTLCIWIWRYATTDFDFMFGTGVVTCMILTGFISILLIKVNRLSLTQYATHKFVLLCIMMFVPDTYLLFISTRIHFKSGGLTQSFTYLDSLLCFGKNCSGPMYNWIIFYRLLFIKIGISIIDSRVVLDFKDVCRTARAVDDKDGGG